MNDPNNSERYSEPPASERSSVPAMMRERVRDVWASMTSVPVSVRESANAMTNNSMRLSSYVLTAFIYAVGGIFMIVTAGVFWCVADAAWHHILGMWPEDPDAAHLRAENAELRTENEALRADNRRLTQGLFERIDQGNPSGEAPDGDR